MADTPTGFIDFNTFYQAQGAAEEAAMQRRQEEMQRLDEEAARFLRIGAGEAETANAAAVRGGGQASMGIESTGSYAQYLKAKKQADALRLQTQMAAKGIGNMGLGQQASANTGAGRAAAESGAASDQMRDYFRQSSNNAIASFNNYAAEQKRRADEAAAAKRARADKDAANLDTARKALQKQIDDAWAGYDRNAGTFGFGTNFTIDGYSGPTDVMTQEWDQRATGLGMDLNRKQLRQQKYEWGKRKEKW